jgi:hypothetical protein
MFLEAATRSSQRRVHSRANKLHGATKQNVVGQAVRKQKNTNISGIVYHVFLQQISCNVCLSKVRFIYFALSSKEIYNQPKHIYKERERKIVCVGGCSLGVCVCTCMYNTTYIYLTKLMFRMDITGERLVIAMEEFPRNLARASYWFETSARGLGRCLRPVAR